MHTCVSCGSNKTEKLLRYRPFRASGRKAKLKAFIQQYLPYLSRYSFLQLQKYCKFPFSGFIYRCNDCGLAQVGKMPTGKQLEDFYTSDYWPKRVPNMDPRQYLSCPRARAQIAFIGESYPVERIASVLEIGAGAATPSLLIREKSTIPKLSEISVVEPGAIWEEYYSSVSIERLATFFPFPIDRKFEHIHASHWFEHISNPKLIAEEINKLLVKNGTLFIEVPFAEAEYWSLNFMDTPHTLFFSVESLNQTFMRAGFKVLNSGRYGIALDAWLKGRWPTEGEFSQKNDEGFWIRALYQKDN